MSGDGKRIAILRAAKPPVIEVWNAVNGTLIKSWNAPETGDIALNHDGDIVIATFGYYRVRIYKAATGAITKNELSIQGRSTDVFASKNTGMFATAGDDGIWIWSEATMAPVQHFPDSSFLNFLPDGTLAVDKDSQVTLWRYIVESRLGHLEAKRRAVLFVKPEFGSMQQIAGGKHLVTLTDKGDVNIWRTDPPTLLQANDDAGPCLRSPVLSADGKSVAALGSYGRVSGYLPSACELELPADAVIFWTADNLSEAKRLKLDNYGDLKELAISADGQRVLIGASAAKKEGDDFNSKKSDDVSYVVIDVQTGKRLFPASGMMAASAAALSRDGRTLYTADGKKIAKWQVDGGASLGECSLGDEDVLDIKAGRDRDRLAVADQKVTIWSVNPDNCAATATALFADAVGDTIELKIAGDLIAAKSSMPDKDSKEDAQTIELWSDAAQKLIAKLGKVDNISDVPFDFFAAKDRVLLAAPNDDELRIFSATQNDVLLAFQFDNNGCCDPRGVRFFPGGDRLLTVWSERNWSRIRVWRTFPAVDALLQYARTAVPECLSPSTRQTLGLDPNPPPWCIEMAKTPYDNQDWKDWLSYGRQNLKPPLPGTAEWPKWLAERKSAQ